MAAITSSDVTISVSVRDREITGAASGKNISIASVTFGNGALTYPTGGVPMPAIGNFGYHKIIDMGVIEQPAGDGFIYKYDSSNRKIKIYAQGVTTGSTLVAAAGTGALVEDSAGAETAARIPNTAVDTSYDFGPLKEIPASITPTAVTLKIMFVGE